MKIRKPGWWRKYAVMLRMEWAVMMAYRSESIIWMLGAFIQPMVSLSVWISISGNGTVGGYNAHDYTVYFLGVLVVERLTRTWDVWELDANIGEGTLSAKLLRPFNPIHWSLAQNLVYKIFYASIMIPAWLVLAIFFPVLRLDSGAAGVLLAITALLISSAMRFLIGYEFGLLAFWTNRATAIYALFEGIHLFFAGLMAPLSMFPAWVGQVGAWLPFYSTVGFPVELLTGKLQVDSPAVKYNFMVQLVWLVILFAIYHWEWRRGLKKYGAVGG
jgi:ABC-2 type transport system permease protein